MSTYSNIDVCSNALVLLGMEPITALGDGTPAGDVCATRYPLLREDILTDNPWNFCIKKAQLSQEVTAPVSRWDYSYLLPSDNLADGVIAAFESSDANAHTISDYVIQNGRLLTNYDTIWVDYLADIDEGYWPPFFVNYMAHALAVDICLTLTRDESLYARIFQTTYGLPSDAGLGGIFGKARRKDSYHAPQNNVYRRYPLIEARTARGGRWWKMSI